MGGGARPRPYDAGAPVPGCDRRGGRCGTDGLHPLSRPSARLFDAGGEDRSVELTEDIVKSLGPKRLLWVDIDDRDDEGSIDEVVRVLSLGDIDLDRIRTDKSRARLTRTADLLHITLQALESDEDDGRLVRRELDILAAPNVVLTVHVGKVAALERFVDGLDGETLLGRLRAGDLMSSLIDEVIVGYFLLAELIEREIDALDQRALHARPGDDVLEAVVSLRRRIGLVRRTLAPHRDALSTLALPELDIEDTIGRPWPGLVDRLDAAMSATENLRDGLLGTFDIHMGRVSQRANDVMRTLTLLSAVLLPAVVLAGIMGMNFKLAFFDEAMNFWLVLGGMVVLAVSILTVAHWRKWL